MKTVQDYLKDPRILNDKGLMDGPEEIREIHAVRLKIQDERARIGEAEYNQRVEASLMKRGITVRRDLTGQGKITPAIALGK
jgi:hypothetical protein